MNFWEVGVSVTWHGRPPLCLSRYHSEELRLIERVLHKRWCIIITTHPTTHINICATIFHWTIYGKQNRPDCYSRHYIRQRFLHQSPQNGSASRLKQQWPASVLVQQPIQRIPFEQVSPRTFLTQRLHWRPCNGQVDGNLCVHLSIIEIRWPGVRKCSMPLIKFGKILSRAGFDCVHHMQLYPLMVVFYSVWSLRSCVLCWSLCSIFIDAGLCYFIWFCLVSVRLFLGSLFIIQLLFWVWRPIPVYFIFFSSHVICMSSFCAISLLVHYPVLLWGVLRGWCEDEVEHAIL